MITKSAEVYACVNARLRTTCGVWVGGADVVVGGAVLLLLLGCSPCSSVASFV
jgi:hypothetical protein